MLRRDFMVAGAALLIASRSADALTTSAGALTVTQRADGLDAPWSFGFLPDGMILITERSGVLKCLDTERSVIWEVTGLGLVVARGQGGLLDLLVPADFAQRRQLFFSFSKQQPGGSGTAVARAELSRDATRLTGWETIFEIKSGSSGGRHFGSRLVEAQDGTLFVTVGDRGDRPSAQDRSNENGSVLRITKEGDIPVDNPFSKTSGVQPAIWSWGHRNPQGAALDATGTLWVIEHGARG
ncbi:MAG: PQQ-dependent sugar dehydrogenase, partial [Pseudomonadota bacterium]